MPDRIQEGVFFRSKESPPEHFSILFLDLVGNPTSIEVRKQLECIWNTIQCLKNGELVDLPGQVVPSGDLNALLSYGKSLFQELKIIHLMPPELKKFRKPNPKGGGIVSLGSGLHYRETITLNVADAAIALQFTGNTALSVSRAIVETWKSIKRFAAETGSQHLKLSGSYTGFGRADKRSWIDFFDGTSNLRSSERLAALRIKTKGQPAADKWKEGGTYICYMRIRVAINDWIRLTRRQQEALVGRDKISGCPLISDELEFKPSPGCPVTNSGNIEDGNNERFRDAARPAGNKILRHSHIHRVNQGRGTPSDPDSRLVFRQGFEFFDGVSGAGIPELGLNFVSFQDTPERIIGMLKLPEWLGGVNFGGDPELQLPGMSQLLQIDAAGFFVVPPREEDGTLPGSKIFDEPLNV